MALFWGTIRIFVSRFDYYQQFIPTYDVSGQFRPDVISQAISQENIWGFGQVVALGLLVLPFISFSGTFLFPFHISTPFHTWSCF